MNVKLKMIRLIEKIKSSPIDSNRFKVYLKELIKLKKGNRLAWIEIQ